MREINSEELKRIQLELLDYFDSFCKENNLNYWLDYGSLLGAIRHKGYIPWDDDLDIAMLREDYEKAASLFNNQRNQRFIFQTPSNDHNTQYPFGKLIDTTTVLFEYGKNGIQTGVYVDVFVYDNSPDSIKSRNRLFKYRDLFGRIRRLQLPMREGIGRYKQILYLVGSKVMNCFSKGFINRLIDKNAKRYESIDTNYVSSFSDPYDSTYFCVNKSLFQNFINVEFEGKYYPAPHQYDYWLRVLYGDYMILPPKDKRFPQHSFVAYFK